MDMKLIFYPHTNKTHFYTYPYFESESIWNSEVACSSAAEWALDLADMYQENQLGYPQLEMNPVDSVIHLLNNCMAGALVKKEQR